MNKKERLMLAIGEIDEKYISETQEKSMRAPIIRAAVCLALVIALGLYMFLPFAPVTSDITAYSGSDYFPLIEGIEDYRLSLLQPEHDNNFEIMLDILGSFRFGAMAPDMDENTGSDMAPTNPGDKGESAGNGSYVESTDNQVDGVIESDLMKMTDKYIFRVSYRANAGNMTHLLRVYSIEKEDSRLVTEFVIPAFADEFYRYNTHYEMYLSPDGNTVTLLRNYAENKSNLSKVGVISLDVSDVNNIKTKAMVSIDGSINTSRMVDGKLLLVSEFVFNRNAVDYNDPTTFVPSIDRGEGAEPILFEDIIFPDTVGNTRYSVVALLDAENLGLLGANALLNFTNEVYVSRDNVYITREYVAENEGVYEDKGVVRNMTDIAVLNYAGDSLESRGVITVNGYAEDQYSFDEKDGYLRLVTTTRWTEDKYSNVASIKNEQNVSLWIFDLADNSLAYSLRNFAIPGEEATAVRFDGDTVYVCTAVVVTFTDPVYFIDLSDYENINSADTGIIEGYSEHLINLGEGFLLGIGRESWQYDKVEIYEQQGDKVVSVGEFKFEGEYSSDYKSYLVNREHNLFGFGAGYIYPIDDQTGKEEYRGECYVLLHWNGYELSPCFVDLTGLDMRSATVRAAYIDGYLYITTDTGFKVEKIN